MKEIKRFSDFTEDLREAGFSLGGENDSGVFSLCSRFGKEIQWHTEEPETDPWEWRVRVLKECDDIAYGKFFFGKSGYITREWYPYFYAARRGNRELEEEYAEGNVSRSALAIYHLLEEHRELPVHLLKEYGNFGREEKAAFEKALVELQNGFYITIFGQTRKISSRGDAYGWFATVYGLAEDFFGEEAVREAKALTQEEAYRRIEEQILWLNPAAKAGRIKKFILG